MKKAVFVLIFCLFPSLLAAEEVRVLTFNIRLSLGEIGKPAAWKNRREHVAQIIRDGKYDFVGVQEAILTDRPDLNQVEDLKRMLPEYEIYTRSRMVNPEEGESTPILWRRDRWERDATEYGCFWLSDTPEVPQSITWNNACPRTVVWGRFHELADGKRTGKSVYFYNTHFDHISELARQNSARQIATFIENRKDKTAPAFLTGDMNCGERSVGMTYLKERFTDTFRAANPDAKAIQTFHGFGKVTYDEKIDYIFLDGKGTVRSSQILRDKKGELFPSDHYPVNATVAF
ncbi:MAG: endonuclease/exonuclease/phosphatase family protein [Planctomycetia bacterium]|nr:endonuclease/exonuclease/phosphatase family protein [Planctomycetia bacterium]